MAAFLIMTVLLFLVIGLFILRENWEDWLNDWRENHGRDCK